MTKLLLATKNEGKIKELNELLKGLGAELLTPEDLSLNLDIEESGETYLDNAAKKLPLTQTNQTCFPWQTILDWKLRHWMVHRGFILPDFHR